MEPPYSETQRHTRPDGEQAPCQHQLWVREACVSAVICEQETSPGLCTPDFDSLLSSLKYLQIGNSGSLHKHKQAQRTKRNKLVFF